MEQWIPWLHFCGHQHREEAGSIHIGQRASGRSLVGAVEVVEAAMSKDTRKELLKSTTSVLPIGRGQWERDQVPEFQGGSGFEEAVAAAAGAGADPGRWAVMTWGRGCEDSWSLSCLVLFGRDLLCFEFLEITFFVVRACLMTDLVMFDAFSSSLQLGEREGAAAHCATRGWWRQSAEFWCWREGWFFKMWR